MNAIASFAQAEAYLLSTIDEKRSRYTSYKLDRMQAFLRELGDPHRAYPSVHVGGTSGKGSTSTMIAAALQASGRRTGLHTKPHLRSVTERARIDGEPVGRERFAQLLEEMLPAIGRIAPQYGAPTYYETTLALALLHFARERVDAAVVEVGLGGRLDGTNVLDPAVAAITSVGYDHTEILGDTLEEIAFEKAGIAKPGVPLVLANVPEAAEGVIERQATAVGAPLVRVRDVVRTGPMEAIAKGQRFAATTQRGEYDVRLASLGIFQRTNAATAIAVLEALPEALRPQRDEIERGFADFALPGRMELFEGRPAVVMDIAHNAEKASLLAQSLRERFPGQRIHCVVAIGESKDARQIVATLAALPATFTFTEFSAAGRTPIPAARLAAIAESLGTWGRAVGDPIEALTVARRTAGAHDVVVVTGSTFVVAALREWYAPAAA
jgi:dihydrofolate synthase/folylpolyglutamate synthase